MKSGRVLLSFSVVSMAPREAILLKSFMRILDERTRQRWLFKPQQDDHEQQGPDLIFLGDEGQNLPADAAQKQPGRKLQMGALSLDLAVQLGWPLRPDELERELNRMGESLVRARKTARARGDSNFFSSSIGDQPVAATQPAYEWRPVAEGSAHSEFAPSTAFSTEFAATVPASLEEMAVAGADLRATRPSSTTSLPLARPIALPIKRFIIALDDPIRLLRWPEARLINTPPRLKLAAFLTGGSHTLGNLQKTSGQTLTACREFLEELHQQGFLSVVPAGRDKSAAHSGLGSAPLMATTLPIRLPVTLPVPLAESAKAARAPTALPSLFARIRARLGIPLAH